MIRDLYTHLYRELAAVGVHFFPCSHYINHYISHYISHISH